MKLDVTIALIAFHCALFSCNPAGGGTATVNGSEPGLFTIDRFSVVVARVIEIKAVDPNDRHPTEFEVILEPLALVAGTLDPSENARIREQFTAGNAVNLSIRKPPPKDAIVLAMLKGDYIVSSAATFMPDGVPLVVINGIGDKRVAETLSRIREARAHPSKD